MEEASFTFSKNAMLFFFSTLAPFLLLLIFLLFSKNRSPKCRVPRGPPALPIIGHLHLLRPPVHQSFHRLATQYGPLIHLRLGSTLCLLASSADVVRDLLKSHDLSFSDRPQSTAARRFAYDSAGFAFAPYGPYWRFMRRLCISELLGPRTVDLLQPIRRAERLALLRALLSKSLAGEPVDLRGELMKMTNNVITRMMASTTTSAEGAREVVKEVAELVGAFNIGDHIGWFRGLDLQGLNRRIEDVHRKFDAVVERMIREKEEARRSRRSEGKGDEGVRDLLDIMLEVAQDENAEMKLTRENIKSFVLDTFTAGTDSSAATIEWAIAELINHPTMLAKAHQEIDEVVGKSRIINESDVASLPYLRAVVKETLRLHPAAPLVIRESTKSIEFSDYDIPAHTSLFINVWSVNRDPEYWEDPLEFRPERFLAQEKDAAVDYKGLHFQFLPFGSGRRMCPAISLATQVIHVTLATLLQCFEWKVGDAGALDMTEGIGLVVLTAHPLLCVPAPRLDPFPSLDL